MHHAAHILVNAEGLAEADVRRQYDALLAEMRHQREQVANLAPAVSHFLKVTDSYQSNLFHCYRVTGLPRTNNDLEHYFGTGRYVERRATGRKVASATLVLRGAVRLVASVATYSHPFAPEELSRVDVAQWRTLRCTLDARHQTRRVQRRFRRDPQTYLAVLEDKLLKLALPS